MKKSSPLWKINLYDILKGAGIAISSAVIMAMLQMLNNVPPLIDDKELIRVALVAFLAYIGKQWSTNSNGQIAKKDN